MLLLPFVAQAQTPISPNTWTGQGTSAAGASAFTVLPASTVPGSAVVNVSQWDRAASLTNTSAGGCYNSSNWQIGGSLAAAQAAGKFIYFTITNDAATELRVTQLLILSQVSATGPQSVQLAYSIGAGPDVLFGATLGTAHTASPENFTFTGSMCLAPSQTARFKLYGWGGTGAAGTLRVNNGTALTAVFAPGITSSAANSSPVCAGNPLNFTGTFSGGIPGYTFSWSGPSGFSSALQNPVIAAPAASASGTYTFTVTDALTCTAAIAATTTATVTAAPAAITGTPIVCEGRTVTLSDADPGGSWSSSNTGIAGVGSGTGIVSGVAQGTATITYSIGTACIATVVATVNPQPQPITGSSSVCVGAFVPLASATSGGTWSSSVPAVATVSGTGVVNGLVAGTTVISYILPEGCYEIKVVTVNSFPAAITGPSAVCSGSTITLSTASTGGTWTSSAPATASIGSGTGIVTGGVAGTATVTYTLPGGCFVTYAITVNPLPAPIGGTAVVCVNAFTTLTETATGGTWSSSDPSIATVSGTGSVLGVSAGTAYISYTFITGCYQVRLVTVNAIPSPITGPSGICIGSSVTLANATPGGTWISSNSATVTIGSTSGIADGNALGTVTITYRLTTTGCFITRTETVNPLPGTISGPATVCPTTTISLSSLPAGGTWVSNATAIAAVDFVSGVVTGVAPGTATITYTLSTGCTATKVVSVHPAPAVTGITPIGDTMMCPGDFVTLTALTGSGLTYHWYVDGGAIPGALSATYIATATGAYQVQLTNTLGCSTLSIPMSVSVNAVTAVITVPGGSAGGCAATGVLLTAPVGAGLSYQWLIDGIPVAGATGDSYTATVSGNVTVVVSNTTGCSATSAPQAVTINPSPAPSVTLSGATTFCQGGSVVITAATGSGYSWQWQNGSTPIPGATGSSYTATASGSYWAIVTNSFGCTSASVATPVVVNPLPDVSIGASGPKVFCAGGSVTLTATAAAGYTYQWFRAGLAIPGATGSSYLATATGGYRIRITNTATGCTDMTHADTVVTNVNTPVIIPLTPAVFCWGGSSHLATSVSSVGFAVSYQWFFNATPIPGATANTYNAGESGNYSCQITIPSSCSVTTITLPVTERPLPDPVITFNGTSFRTATYYTTYQWYKDLAPIPGANAYSTLALANGSYKVFVTDTNGCQSASLAYALTGWHGSNTTGLGNLSQGDIVIYPNPAQQTLHIQSALTVRAIITSVDGRVMIDQPAATDIDVNKLASGLYIIAVYDVQGTLLKTEKFVKTTN